MEQAPFIPQQTPAKTFSKKKLILIASGVLLCATLLSAFLWYKLTFPIITPDEPVAEVTAEETEIVPEQQEASNTGYGTIDAFATSTFMLSITSNGVVEKFTFLYDDMTTFQFFSFADDNDLVGTYMEITSKDINVGDSVAVYTTGAFDTVTTAPQHVSKVIKLKQ